MEAEKIFGIIAEVMHIERNMVSEQTRFTEDLGMDSLSMYEVMIRIEKEFDIEIDQETCDGFLSAGDLVYAVSRLYGGSGKN